MYRIRHRPPRGNLLLGPDPWSGGVSYSLGRDVDRLADQQPARARTLGVVLDMGGVWAPTASASGLWEHGASCKVESQERAAGVGVGVWRER